MSEEFPSLRPAVRCLHYRRRSSTLFSCPPGDCRCALCFSIPSLKTFIASASVKVLRSSVSLYSGASIQCLVCNSYPQLKPVPHTCIASRRHVGVHALLWLGFSEAPVQLFSVCLATYSVVRVFMRRLVCRWVRVVDGLLHNLCWCEPSFCSAKPYLLKYWRYPMLHCKCIILCTLLYFYIRNVNVWMTIQEDIVC